MMIAKTFTISEKCLKMLEEKAEKMQLSKSAVLRYLITKNQGEPL